MLPEGAGNAAPSPKMAAWPASPRLAAGPHASPAHRSLIGREAPGPAVIGRGGAGPEGAAMAAMAGSLSLSLDAAALEVMEALELLQQRREQLEEHLRQVRGHSGETTGRQRGQSGDTTGTR
ncbi:uncharacterized protein ACIQIH_002136, partial [Cyanocitta cristata]